MAAPKAARAGREPVSKARRPGRPLLAALALAAPAALLLLALGGLAAPLTGAPAARAEQAWQLGLPRSWRTFSQTPPPPPGEEKPVALVVAGNADIGAELAVLRVPLSSDPKDPDAAAVADLVRYFDEGGVEAEKVVDAVAQSQKTTPGLVKFAFVGQPIERTKGGRRYVRYEYESGLCRGTFVQGVNGNVCQRPGTSEELPALSARHAITVTVTSEGKKGGTNYLWLLDVSGPVEAWDILKESVDSVSDSFELGSEEQLEKDRTAEVTPEQLKALKELQEAGALPQDGGLFR